MPNPLVITVTRFENALDARTASYGFTASDCHVSVYDNSFDSLEDFRNSFSTQQELVHHVVSLPEFNDGVNIESETEIELLSFSSVIVHGYE